MMDYDDYLKKAESECTEPPGHRHDGLVTLRASYDQISDAYERLLANAKSCAECKILGIYCEPCADRLSRVRYRMHEAAWELDIFETPPPTDEAERREWLHKQRYEWILVANIVGTPHGTPRDILNSYPVQWIDTELLVLDESAGPAALTTERIQWNDTAGRIALLFDTLVERGYITMPLHGGSKNYAALSRLIFNAFDIRAKGKGKPVTAKTIEQAMKRSGHKTAGVNPFVRILPRSAAQ